MNLFDVILALLLWTMPTPNCTVTGLPPRTNCNDLNKPKMIAQGEGRQAASAKCRPLDLYSQRNVIPHFSATNNPAYTQRHYSWEGQIAWHRAIHLDAEFKKAWMRRGMVRYSRGKYAGAVADFAESVRLDPNDMKAFKLRELTAAKQRQVRLAFFVSVRGLLYLDMIGGVIVEMEPT